MCPSYRATQDERHSTRGRARIRPNQLTRDCNQGITEQRADKGRGGVILSVPDISLRPEVGRAEFDQFAPQGELRTLAVDEPGLFEGKQEVRCRGFRDPQLPREVTQREASGRRRSQGLQHGGGAGDRRRRRGTSQSIGGSGNSGIGPA